ncbi:flagellar motor switch phosphatase FliY [Ectobacillus sp. JY-23]|uniref:flagellar motor switch phosphatase FliY n=1 Tax=Ectobacillus sp. JY-23 TaxID=2933872 RepID=UPI001FF4FE2D|nr:flagellar motor switch phosphatase FliY [Ectobacillus sp. JY-23]UOY93399.1 flagellar motor switch phosphatase FliY [Ectobacillus sp. JY-23]
MVYDQKQDILADEVDNTYAHILSQEEKDILGEIANISFGSASTILSTLLNKTVTITAPQVDVVSLIDNRDVEIPHVVLNIHFTKGLDMDNLLVMNQNVALAIADLMMMGDGDIKGKELTELELSAVQEAMNQMMGFAATSMSEFFQETVDMSPPTIQVVKLIEELEKNPGIEGSNVFIRVAFNLTIDNLVKSKLVQIVSLENAKKMIHKLYALSGETNKTSETPSIPALSQYERDALGEIANISIGSASTVLSTLLNQKVHISVPAVDVISAHAYDEQLIPFVVLNVDFIHAVNHQNVFVLSKEVALVMVDLMMMGTGDIEEGKELTEFELSATQEVMNQMMGHAATSMSELFGDVVDITPPVLKVVTLAEELNQFPKEAAKDGLVQITFELEIGELIRSTMYQFLPLHEARVMIGKLSSYTEDFEAPDATTAVEVIETVQLENFVSQERIVTGLMSDETLSNVEVRLEFIFGSTTKTIDEILKLTDKEVVSLEEEVEDPIQIMANGILIGFGELVNVNGYFGVRVTKTL